MVPICDLVRARQVEFSRQLVARGERPLGDDELVMCEACDKRQKETDARVSVGELARWQAAWLRLRDNDGAKVESLPADMRAAW